MKRVASIQDISCLGRCSLTVALPVLAVMGVECAVIPTAVLSTHTIFPDFTCRDLTDELLPIARQEKPEGEAGRHLQRLSGLSRTDGGGVPGV